ncbi:aldose epimerase family protein [Geodermatophilus chilensis]|uniref:hypothetical protein n=1 Tax=Geodermatophilus chilensis TaxID=2035835 RepID=UPI00130007FC|nr:hypothetical protein [Geodermatophilus chilensis]
MALLRAGWRVGDLVVDHCSTDLERDPDGPARVPVHRPGRRRRRRPAGRGPPVPQLFTGDVLPEPRRRRGPAVEPVTCPPDPFRTGEAVRRLEPGESTTARWGLQAIG